MILCALLTRWDSVLINTSGSGKTRLCLEGLCQNWGFYGVVQQASDDIGSGDFWKLMSSLDGSRHYQSAKSRGIHDDDAVRHMHEKAEHRVLQFLVARFILLNLLIEEASKSEGGLRPSDHRRLWVLLQVRPTDMLVNDAFTELADALWEATAGELKKRIKGEYSKLEDTLELAKHPKTGVLTRRPLYCILDQIQITTTIRMGEFRSDDKKKGRPLLRPIWQSVVEILEPKEMLVILSGTAIHENSLLDVLTSSALKFKPYDIVRDIGAFDDPDAQRQYIEHYLPNNQSTAWQEFLKRAWGWCRGRYFRNYVAELILTNLFLRYRSTASLVVLALVTGPHSPHKILNKFVESITKFLPTDGEEWCNSEPDVSNFDMEPVRGWDFDRLGM